MKVAFPNRYRIATLRDARGTESGAATPTKVLSLLVPDLVRRCDVRSLYSRPLQHLHRLNHPNCPTDDRLEPHAPRAAAPTLLSRLSDDWVSYVKIIRLPGCRQSQSRQANRPDDSAERA